MSTYYGNETSLDDCMYTQSDMHATLVINSHNTGIHMPLMNI